MTAHLLQRKRRWQGKKFLSSDMNKQKVFMTYTHENGLPQQTSVYTPPVWKGLTISHNRNGHEEAFAIGPDNYVWSYLTSLENGTAGRLVSTGLEGLQFVLATPATGSRLLVAGGSSTLRMTVESVGLEPRWQKPQRIAFAGLQSAVAISELHSLEFNGHALIGVLAVHQNQSGLDSYCFWVAKWTGEQLQWCSTPVALDGSDPLGNPFIMYRKSSEHALQ
jgi:hypothetical protein